MGKRIAAGIIVALMLFMVAAPGSAVRADGAENVTPGDAARTSSDGDANEDTYIDSELSENLRRAAIDAGVDQNADGKISVAEAEGCTELTIKKISDKVDETIAGLEYFKCLRGLCIDGGFYVLPDLSGLLNLGSLNVPFNELEVLQEDKLPPNLRWLDAGDNQLTEFPDVEKLINLEWLNLGGNQLKELAGVENLTNLKSLYVYDNQLTELDGVDKLAKLSNLDVRRNQLTELVGIEKLTNLEYLGVSGNQLTELAGVENLINLGCLEAADNQLTVLPDIKYNTRIYGNNAYFSGNQICESEACVKLPQQLLNDKEWFGKQGFLKEESILKLTDNLQRAAILAGMDANGDEKISVAEAEVLTELTITKEDGENDDIFGIGCFRNLQNLKIEGGFCKLPQLKILENLERLDVSNNQLTVLPDLKSCTNLSIEGTDFRNNQITESEARAKLPQELLDNTEWFERQGFLKKENTYIESKLSENLRRAAIAAGVDVNKDGKISAAEAETCTELKIAKEDGEDESIIGLEYFCNLQSLTIEGGFRVLPNLRDVPNLQSLDVRFNALTELPGLENLSNLTYLCAMENQLTELPKLDGLTNLEYLDVGYNQLTELSSLDELSNLKKLRVSFNPLTSLPQLDKLSGLQELWAYNCRLKELPELDGLSNLTDLKVSGNKLAALQADKLPKNLEEFDVGANQLTEVLGLGDLNKLTKLDVSQNQLTEVPELGGLSKLTYLNVSQNQLTELIGLEDLNNLSCLYAGYNQLTKLPDLKKSYNLVSDVHSPDNPELNPYPWSDFSGNQIYESEARAKLPQQLLDDTEWFERQGFLKDEVPEPEPELEPQPGDKYEIDLGDGDTGIGSDAFEELLKKNKHCTVEINLDNGVRFSFEMGSMHVVEGKDVYDFGCTLIRNYEKLPPAMQSVIRNNSFVTRILYNYSGKLPGTVSIRIYVGQQYAGQTLYYYRENKDNTFTFMQEALVDADGYITVQQDHCSDYVLLGEKRENNTPGGPGTDTPSGTTPGSPSDLTLDTPANGTPGTSSDSAPSTAIDVLSGTANPLPVTQAAATLAGSTTAPKTGDDNAVTVHMMLLLVSMTGILTACIGIAGRRRRVLPGRKQ